MKDTLKNNNYYIFKQLFIIIAITTRVFSKQVPSNACGNHSSLTLELSMVDSRFWGHF